MRRRYADFTEEEKEKARAASRKWKRSNPEKARSHGRSNPEKVRSQKRKWKRSNPESVYYSNRKWIQANPEKVRAAYQKWAHANRERVNYFSRRRRAIKIGLQEHFTEYEWKLLCEQYGNHCIYPSCNRTDLTPDHVIPLVMGGKDTIDNIQPLCLSHNCSKGAKYIDYRNREPIRVDQLSFLGMAT